MVIMRGMVPRMAKASLAAAALCTLPVPVFGQQCSDRPGSATLPELITFSFQASSTERLEGFGTDCDDTIKDGVKTSDGKLAILQEEYSGSCWGWAAYSHSNYTIDFGTFSSSQGDSFPAYRVHKYSNPAKSFMAGKQIIYMKLEAGTVVYALTEDGPMLAEQAGLCGNDPAACLNRTKEDMVSIAVAAPNIKETLVLFVAPPTVRLSQWPIVSDTVAGAWLAGSPQGYNIEARIFQTPAEAQPRDPTLHDLMGPDSHQSTYGHPRRYHSVKRADKKEGVVWTDASDASKLWMTWFEGDLKSASTSLLYTPVDKQVVYAVTDNGDDSIVVVLAEPHPDRETDKKAYGRFRVVKLDSTTGEEKLRSELPENLDIWNSFASGGAASWDTAVNKIAVTAARTMTMAGDGLNHQGGLALLINATSLQLEKSWWISSHSWSNTLIPMTGRESGKFMAADIGDNYPRGINMHYIDGQAVTKSAKVVYSFKTQHAQANDDGGCVHWGTDFGEPYYTEGDKTYCKVSNDNRVYTELARPGLVVAPDGVLVFFAGEQPAYDNKKVGKTLNQARDIAFIKVSDDLQEVLSEGPEETGGFYTFGGGWSDLSHKGVTYLTNYNQSSVDEVATRIKTFTLSADRIFLSYEVWGDTGEVDYWGGKIIDYKRTEFMELDMNGKVVRDKWQSCYPLRQFLNNDVFVIDGKGIAYVGGPEGLMRYEICVGDDCYKEIETTTEGVETSEAVQGGEEGDGSTETETTPNSVEGGEGSTETETTDTQAGGEGESSTETETTSKADVGGEVSTETDTTETPTEAVETSEAAQGGEDGVGSTETETTPKSGEGGEESTETETTETSTTTKAVVSFTTKLVGGKPNEFDESKFISSVASASGVDKSSVEVDSVSFVTTAQYKFLEDVTTDEIETAVAGTLGLDKTNVEATLVSGRRLKAARRLAVTADVKVTTPSAADATTLAQSLNDTETLATQLSQVTGKNISAPEVTSVPVVTVEVVTRIKSDTGEPPKTPDASELTDAMPGAEVAVDVNVNENVDANVEVETSSTTSVQRGDALNHAASMQGQTLALLCAFAVLLRTV